VHSVEDTGRDIASRVLDGGSFEPVRDRLESRDPLEYPGYPELLERAAEKAPGREAVAAGPATVGGFPVEAVVFDFTWLAGSMGEVAGERLARALERAALRGAPCVLVTHTGGARMQEGMLSLVQMAKVVAARLEMARAHSPLVAVLGHPTTGGVLASAAALADVTLAVEGATIGFAGPRVARRFTGAPLPSGSHTAAGALGHGLIDAIVREEEIPSALAHLLGILAPDAPERTAAPPPSGGDDAGDAWAVVETVRSPSRPRAPQLLDGLADASIRLRGDRAGFDDPALVVALTRIAGRRVVVMALDRDHAPGPAAYRKAQRALDLATRLNLPVVSLIDTRGADLSAAAEAGGIAWGIGALIQAMLEAPVPILCVVTGTGGSGGGLAFATGDVLLAYSDTIFWVIAPEAAAEILWRDVERASEAARLLKLTAGDLAAMGIVDGVVASPLGPDSLRSVLVHHLALLTEKEASPSDRAATRQRRWRTIGGS